MGDAPFSVLEEFRFRLVLRDLDAHDLTSVISVGDIFWRPCTDEMYQRARDRFNGLRHPVIYTPGDNEWFDCWEPGSGGYQPQERLYAGFGRCSTRCLRRASAGGGLRSPASRGSWRTCAGRTRHSSLPPCISSEAAMGDELFPNRTEDESRRQKREPRPRRRGCVRPSPPPRPPTPPR